MKYYIFRVKDSLGQEYYIFNNMYIGYVGFDSNHLRSRVEHNGLTEKELMQRIENEEILTFDCRDRCKRQYQLFAEGYVYDHEIEKEFHRMNCKSKRFSLYKAKKYAKIGNLKISKDKKWYEVYYPNKNSSESYLREIKSKNNKPKEIR
jgi:hypothetical protein